jgi:hypothetical protein
MNTSKFTLIIDGHWWMRSRNAAIRRPNNDALTFKDEHYESDRQLLITKLSMDLAYELRSTEHFVDDVIFVTDVKSWRKKYEYITPPWSTDKKGLDYKSDRVYDKSVDYLARIRVFDDWLNMLYDKANVATIRATGNEGDDLIGLVTKHLNEQGKNALFLSTDKDLIQCTQFNSNTQTFSAYYYKAAGNKANRYRRTNVLWLVQNSSINDDMSMQYHAASKLNVTPSIFDFSITEFKSSSNAIVAMNDYFTYRNENMPYFIFYKICLGDGGDSVTPLMTRPSGKVIFRSNAKHVYSTLEKLNMHTNMQISYLYNTNFIAAFIKELHAQFYKHHIAYTTERGEFFFKKFAENRKLMYLHECEMPQYAKDNAHLAIFTHLYDNKPKANIKSMHNYHDITSWFSIIDSNSFFAMHASEVTKS